MKYEDYYYNYNLIIIINRLQGKKLNESEVTDDNLELIEEEKKLSVDFSRLITICQNASFKDFLYARDHRKYNISFILSMSMLLFATRLYC